MRETIVFLLFTLLPVTGDPCLHWRDHDVDSACIAGGPFSPEAIRALRQRLTTPSAHACYDYDAWHTHRQFVQVIAPCLNQLQSCAVVTLPDQSLYGGCFPDDQQFSVSYKVVGGTPSNGTPTYDFASDMEAFPAARHLRLGKTCAEIYDGKSVAEIANAKASDFCADARAEVNGVAKRATICCCKGLRCSDSLVLNHDPGPQPPLPPEPTATATEPIHWLGETAPSSQSNVSEWLPIEQPDEFANRTEDDDEDESSTPSDLPEFAVEGGLPLRGIIISVGVAYGIVCAYCTVITLVSIIDCAEERCRR